jgi:hypothetical protein
VPREAADKIERTEALMSAASDAVTDAVNDGDDSPIVSFFDAESRMRTELEATSTLIRTQDLSSLQLERIRKQCLALAGIALRTAVIAGKRRSEQQSRRL